MDDQLVGGIGLHFAKVIFKKKCRNWLLDRRTIWGKGIAGKAIPQIIEYGFQNMDIVRILHAYLELILLLKK